MFSLFFVSFAVFFALKINNTEDNYNNESCAVTTYTVPSFQVAAKNRIVVFGADGSPFYDSAVCSGDLFVPQSSFFELVGAQELSLRDRKITDHQNVL
jgi:hypothetical protein